MYFMPKYNLMEQMDSSTEVVEKIVELRFNLHSISETIICEEPNIMDWVNFLFNLLPGYLQTFKKGIEKRNFEAKDFLQYFRQYRIYLASIGSMLLERYQQEMTCKGKER